MPLIQPIFKKMPTMVLYGDLFASTLVLNKKKSLIKYYMCYNKILCVFVVLLPSPHIARKVLDTYSYYTPYYTE